MFLRFVNLGDRTFSESFMQNNGAILNIGRGIGPCYEDRASRVGLRLGDLLVESYLKERLSEALAIKNRELAAFGAKTYTVEELLAWLEPARKRLSSYIIDTSEYLSHALEEGKKVLFEGAQGAMLCFFDISSSAYEI